MPDYSIQSFPKSRLASIDVCEIGRQKHHVVALLEIDVTESRAKIKDYKKEKGRISFTGWLLKAISYTIQEHARVAAFRKGKNQLLVFNDIHLSVLVEKEFDGQKVPFPVLVEKAGEKSIEEISRQILQAKQEPLSEQAIVLQRRSNRMEKLYYHLPGFARRTVWRYLLRHPRTAFPKMGNVSVTSIGMIGRVNGWFVPIAIHPVAFGIGSIIRKPSVIDDQIKVREILNMTVLLDHDVIDGAPMARFISDLTRNIENGIFL